MIPPQLWFSVDEGNTRPDENWRRYEDCETFYLHENCFRYKCATGYCKLSKETQENVRRKIEAFALPQNTRTFKYIVPGLFWDINISPHSWYAVVIPNHICIKRVFNLDIDKHVLFTPLITFKFVIYTFKYVLYERSIIYIIYSSIEIMWVKYR